MSSKHPTGTGRPGLQKPDPSETKDANAATRKLEGVIAAHLRPSQKPAKPVR